ncbi:MAG: hypothetical protein NTZ09_04705 [Candidatus Hydrogenedentes bacterium]|nr:hypothetical protein [Candidatus Hydrogenedentota bacterium]
MALDEKDVERTIEATQKNLNAFAGLEKEFQRIVQEKEALARGLGADNFAQVVAASQKGMTDQARRKMQEAQQALVKELQEDALAAEIKVRQDQSSQRGSGTSKVRRMGRMV